MRLTREAGGSQDRLTSFLPLTMGLSLGEILAMCIVATLWNILLFVVMVRGRRPLPKKKGRTQSMTLVLTHSLTFSGFLATNRSLTDHYLPYYLHRAFIYMLRSS